MMSTSSVVLFSAVRDALRGMFFADQSRSIIPFVPRPLRVLFLLLLVLNVRSLPFTWHFRVFRPVLYARLKALTFTFSSRDPKDAWLDSLCPVGKSPFELKSTYETWASLDESDYNLHLSNSSYAKVLDMQRIKFAITHLIPVFRDGCWMALGATHLKFIHEIPLGAKYEMRMYIGSWDNKWMYVVARFVTKNHPLPNQMTTTSDNIEGAKAALQPSSSSTNLNGSIPIPIPKLHTPGSGDTSGISTPTPNPNPVILGSSGELESIWAEAPDETLHCVAINEICIKRGRVTVPPALALAGTGCGMSSEQWRELKDLRAGKGMRDLLVGGWRNVLEKERWWDDTLDKFESERVRRLAVLKGVREGLESARFL